MKDVKVFLKKKKKKDWQNCLEQYKSLQEDEKQKLAEYRKKYYKMRKKKARSSLYETIILQNNALEKSFDEEWFLMRMVLMRMVFKINSEVTNLL